MGFRIMMAAWKKGVAARRSRVGRFGLLWLAPILCAGLGCKDLSAKRPGKKDAVLAQVGDTAISVADFEERINSQSPYVRARYASLDHKKEFLDNLVKFEVLAAEARRQGIDRDPEIQRTLKQVMIQKLLRQRFDKLKAEDVTDAEIDAYFRAHPDEFNRPPEVRASLLLVADEATAKKVLADPRAQGLENLGFRDLVAQFSTDAETKERGGDLRFFDAQNRELPRELVDAAFKLVNIGEVSPPVKTSRGYAILKLTGQRRALVRTLAEVSQQIRAKLFREKRQRLMDDYELALRKSSKISVHEERLAEVKVDLSGSGTTPSEYLRPEKGSGLYHPAGQDQAQASPARPGQPPAIPGAGVSVGTAPGSLASPTAPPSPAIAAPAAPAAPAPAPAGATK